MSDPSTWPNTIRCSVLRLGDYQRGEWLLSDLNNSMLLILDHVDRLKAALGDDLALALHLPYLALVNERYPSSRWSKYAVPLWGGPFTFSGNWLWSDDSRFPADHPIPIYDAPQSD